MLGINWSDVVNILGTLTPHLVAIGVALTIAVIVTVAVNRRTVTDAAVRKLAHAQTWIVAFVAVVVSVMMMVYGPLATILTNATTVRRMLTDETIATANALGVEIEREAVTLLKNDDGSLPYADDERNVNVFGWASVNPVYGGTGSGSLSDTYPTVSLLDGLHDAGLTTNEELSELYTSYRADRPEVGMWSQDWTLPEVPAADYPADLIADAQAFSDNAVVVVSRTGGEHIDLPTDMKAAGIAYEDNSDDYADYEQGQSILELSRSERDLLDLVTSNFANVTFVYNGANALQFDFLADYPGIDSVLWVPPAGQNGFTALGEVLAGETNPSGRTADTFVTDLKSSPWWNNIGGFAYDNMDEYAVSDDDPYMPGQTPTFVNYVEGIYVGYRFYETAAQEGLIDYDETVAYPFGHGLSYTTFSQKMGDVTYADGKVTFDVTVTNTGEKAGKDVIEVYYNPPYMDGGIEKASVNLVAFDKTDLLEPGASQTMSIEFDDDDMASYDDVNAKSYVLEAGDYAISIRSDAHTVIDEKTVTVADDIVWNTADDTHDGDLTVATNQFDQARGDVTYLSRAGHFANYDEATAAPADYAMDEESKALFINNGNYDPAAHDDASDEMPTTGAKNGVRLVDLYGADWDDPRWDDLLDELTVDEMDDLIAMGGYGTQAVRSIGKIAMSDLDGPASLNNNFTGVGSIGFPSSSAFAATWNVDLAEEFGSVIADMAHDMDASGWYAPSMNIHRSAFAGRNFEYFSEDGLLSGAMASREIAGAKAKGVYAFMKHFALNEQETNRWAMLTTWATEQSIREIYLKPFEMSVKDGGAQAVMSSYNYVGPVYSAAYEPLQRTVLRDEWGFRGMVLSDYFAGFGFQNGDQMIRNGNDVMLSTIDGTNHITDRSATSVKAMREAVHNILYTTVNSYHYADGEPEVATPLWQTITWIVAGVAVAVAIGLEILTVRRFVARRRETTASRD